MANYKTPPNRRLVRISRPYDFLYDSTFSMPSRQDFLNNAAFGARSVAKIKLKTVYNSMFSELKRDRRIEPCFALPKPNNLESFMPQYNIRGIPVMPMDTGPLPVRRADVGGADRAKYTMKPKSGPPLTPVNSKQQMIRASGQSAPGTGTGDVTGADRAKYAMRYGAPIYRMHQEAFDFNKLAPEEKKKILQTQKTRRSGFISRGMQTDFRDSETQTDPYSPPYKLPYTGAYPKVLALVKLTWGNVAILIAKGLPFTLEDIVVIERALSRRMLEHTNRVGENDADFEKRIKLMEELEAQQWADREKELGKIVDLKMEITGKLLGEYSGNIATGHTMRLERLQEVLKNKNAKHLEYVKHQYFRNLRKLETKYFEGNACRKRNIIKDYTEFDSPIYAPLVRNGTSMDVLNPVPSFQFDVHRDFESLEKLTTTRSFIRKELTFDFYGFQDRIKQCEPTGSDKRLERRLGNVTSAFKDPHGLKKLHAFDFTDGSDMTSKKQRPSSPVVAMDDDSEMGQRRPHCITLQKIARGRVIQKLIRNEMEENMNELLGMKLMFDMDPNCQRLEEGQMQKLIAMKKQSEADAAKDPTVKEVVGHLEGETLNKMLDFLDKEMIRLIDERKIHALILLAERERRRKEAIEAGRRNMEEENRRSLDEIFRQTIGIHQSTVDIYLEDMYIESSDRTADEISRNHVRQMASTINEASYSLPTDIGDFEQEELAAELVSSFMIPEISRLTHLEKVDMAGTRYKKASGQVMDAIFTAHDVSKSIVADAIVPIVKDHNVKGWAATDGSVSMVDEMIKGAVLEAMQSEATATAALEEEAKQNELKDEIEVPEEQLEQPEDEAVSDDLQPPEIPADETLRPQTPDDLPEEVEEQLQESQLVVNDEVRASLAAKSLQIALNTEPCQAITNIYSGATEAIDDMFIEARRKLVPDSEEEDLSRVTLDDDTDDD